MLDTIVLTLDPPQFSVADPERFSPSAEGLFRPPFYLLGARGNFSCVQNGTKADFDAAIYRPRLTLTKRKSTAGFSVTLRIEFSAPKLIFGNNFDELCSEDFETVLAALHKSLMAMGIRVLVDDLRAARVSAIHYSKNIAFTDFTTCSMVMSELERIDLNQRLDLSRTDWRNGGHAVRYHANSFEITFYDKMKDLRQAKISEKRAIEDDYRPQLDIFKDRAAFLKQLEILRMEVRLGTRAKIMSIMKRVGATIEPTFAALFDASIAKDVLGLFWAEVRAQLPVIDLARDRRPEDVFAELAVAAKGSARVGTLLQQLGAAMLVGSVGFRAAGAILSRHCCARSWQRCKRGLKSLPAAKSAGFAALKHVDATLAEFKPLCMSTFQVLPAPSSILINRGSKKRENSAR